MPVKRTEVTFDWTGAVQSKNDRKLQPGQLVEAVNIRWPDEGPGPIDKRFGLDRTVVSAFGGASGVAYSGPATHMEEGGAVPMWRDTGDQLWVQDPDAPTTALHRGVDPRCYPSWYGVNNQAPRGRACKPVLVARGGDLWLFTVANLASAGTTWIGYHLTIFDATTRAQKWPTVAITATNIVGLTAAVDGSNNVWVFWFEYGANDNLIRSHKFTANPTASPSTVTFATLTGGIKSLDAHYLSSTAKVAVAAVTHQAGAPATIRNYHAFLDTSTGQAAAAPAPVTQSQTGDTDGTPYRCANGVSIIPSTGSDGFFYYCFAREKPSAAETIEMVRVKVQTSDLTVSSKTVLKEYVLPLTGSTKPVLAVTSGHLDGTTETYFTTYWIQDPATPDNTENVVFTDKHTYTGSVASTFFNFGYVAGKPFKVGTNWHVLLGFDDGANQRAQRKYLVYRSDGYVLATVLDGEGDAIFHGGGRAPAPPAGGAGIVSRFEDQATHIVAPVSISATKVAYGLMNEQASANSPDPVIAEIDFAATYYSQVPEIVPGGFPKFVGRQDTVKELSPMVFPFLPLTFVSLGTGSVRSVNRMTYRYVVRKSDGSLHRSAAKAIESFTFLDSLTTYILRVPSCPFTNSTGVMIEVYASINGGTDVHLQQTVANNPFSDTVPVTIRPQNFDATGEILDTGGGALEPAPLPPCRLVVRHKRRTWLVATPTREIWPSLEHRSGRGPEFNEALNFEWANGTGEEQAVASVDDDTLAIAKVDAIALVTGPGPDGLGNGSFDVRTLPGKDGCSNPAAFIQGPLGVYFPRHSDGRMCLLTPGGVQEIHQGMEDYAAFVWTGAVDLKSQRQMRWFATNGKILVLDYGHPTQDQPWGQWILYEGAGLPAAWTGARLINGEAVSMEAGTSGEARTWKEGTGYTDNGSSIARRWKTGRMAPFGTLREFDVDHVRMSSRRVGAGSVTHEYLLTNDQGTVETHTDADTATEDVVFRASVFRTREVRLEVRETVVNGERGRQFDGVVVEFCEYGRAQSPRRRIA